VEERKVLKMGRKKVDINRVYSCDFETRNSEINIAQCTTSVWLWDCCDIVKYKHVNGNKIDEFIDYIKLISPCTLYFFNLKFDGEFILSYLLKNNFKYRNSRKLKTGEFSTCISEDGVWYCLKICFSSRKIVEIRDASKKIPGSVESIPKSYNLPISKGEIDYMMERSDDYIATSNEIKYIKNDTEIIARVLSIYYSEGLTHMTSSSDALHVYKKMVGINFFKHCFPVLDLQTDDFIRESYRGGLCMVREKYVNKNLSNVRRYDVNSLYPYQMREMKLPYGSPLHFNGEPDLFGCYDLFIVKIKTSFSLKQRGVPTLVNRGMYSDDMIIKSSGDFEMELTLTNVDLELFLKNYDVWTIEYVEGYMFMSTTKLFYDYIDKYYGLKSTADDDVRQLYKNLLNMLYGKFGKKTRQCDKIPYLVDGEVKYKNGELSDSQPIYTSVASFITSYGRKQLVECIMENYDNFVYCDTDSVHLLGEMSDKDKLHEIHLGKWKDEGTFIKAKYLAQKTYFGIDENGKDCKKIVGASKKCKQNITFDNFMYNMSYSGKLRRKKVEGGVLLVPSTHKIKQKKSKGF
jgi:hypothetical protein